MPRSVPVLLVLCLALLLPACTPPIGAGAGADALLHPRRRPVTATPRLPYRDVAFQGERDAVLRGWFFPARGPSRGLVVYLHGSADNRASGLGLAARYVPQGYDVLLYDARAHGASGGANCTWGVLERRDLSHALDAVHATRAALVGVSLGAAVAIMAAADDPRIRGVVAAAPFATLAGVARERAPRYAPRALVRAAFSRAEREGGFRIAEASPLAAAPQVHVPVLLVHGEDDRVVVPHHSRDLYARLGGPRRLVMVKGAGHSDAIPRIWPEVDAWLAAALPAPALAGAGRSAARAR